MHEAQDILDFWFAEAGPKRWFRQSDAFDTLCETRFSGTFAAACAGECWAWRATAPGRAAEIILLDQFSRNIFRGRAEAFARDGMALVLAQEAVASGDHLKMSDDERYFTYMPYMHSESLAVHDEALRLFTELGNGEALRYEKLHREVIARFGRYPGRNVALNRTSTPAELDYLNEHGGF